MDSRGTGEKIREKVILPCIIGPTAVGKTSLALDIYNLSEEVRFVLCDSRKVYRFMDIGTAKPPPSQRPLFSMVDIITPNEIYNAQRYREDAEEVIGKMIEKGHIPVLIGGTPLYFKSLFEGLFLAPPVDLSIREGLKKRAVTEQGESLYRELMETDPETASTLHPNDKIRIIRALEVYYQTGIPISVMKKTRKQEAKYTPFYIGIYMERKKLYDRINRRVLRMIDSGLVEEVRKLLEMGYRENLASMNAIGYREIVQYLKGGETLRNTIRKIQKATRIYARRQENFFGSFKGVLWIERDTPSIPLRILRIIRSVYNENRASIR